MIINLENINTEEIVKKFVEQNFVVYDSQEKENYISTRLITLMRTLSRRNLNDKLIYFLIEFPEDVYYTQKSPIQYKITEETIFVVKYNILNYYVKYTGMLPDGKKKIIIGITETGKVIGGAY